ncbi:EcsC family protein [Microcoleus sp. FACHB-SPT15]|uniref:EcsC family protein n=1 Tax=Microcoleus sp. FACHB-SPT15 TaxID=2692830 RepID=UPI00177E9182|nr:EcsC family protein [Microcoleus sp. FACHB-SPT15]MBD1807855.1 EcsC family protein [Microcoleus sp. FACHB-SPT15]
MDFSELEKALESLIDWIISSEPQEITSYVDQLRSDNPRLSNRQIAEKIVYEQSINNGLLGAVTGLGGLITLPVTIPLDLVKTWKIQAFTIRCIAHVYGYTPQTTDEKTDIFLVLSNGSLEELKNLVILEAQKAEPKYALQSLDKLKKSVVQEVTKAAPKYAAKAIVKYGGKKVVSYTMKGLSKHLVKGLWKLGGKKVVEKALQKSIGKVVPVIGALVGGGIDWFATQAVGNLAIEYYENSVPEWVDEVFCLCTENDEV